MCHSALYLPLFSGAVACGHVEECVTHGDWVFLALAAVAGVGALFGLNLGGDGRRMAGLTSGGVP